MTTARRGIVWLLGEQRAIGDWPTAPILLIPSPMRTKPDGMSAEYWSMIERGTDIVVADEGGVYTSSSAVWALGAYRTLTSQSHLTAEQRQIDRN